MTSKDLSARHTALQVLRNLVAECKAEGLTSISIQDLETVLRDMS